jgi:hypothetical protein
MIVAEFHLVQDDDFHVAGDGVTHLLTDMNPHQFITELVIGHPADGGLILSLRVLSVSVLDFHCLTFPASISGPLHVFIKADFETLVCRNPTQIV